MVLSKKIYSILEETDGDIALYFEDVQTGEVLEINPNMIFSAASTIKIPLDLLVMKKAYEGQYKLDDQIEISEGNRVGGTGIIKGLDKRFKPTILDLITLSIVVSDNTATNELIDLAGGPEAISKFINEELEMVDTKFQRKMLDIEAMKSNKNNVTSVRDLGKLLVNMVNGKAVSREISEQLIDIMKRQQFMSKLPAIDSAIAPYEPEENREVTSKGKVVVANKTGDLWQVQHDMGIFILPGNKYYVLAVLTKNLENDQEGVKIIKDISKVVYEEMARKYDN